MIKQTESTSITGANLGQITNPERGSVTRRPKTAHGNSSPIFIWHSPPCPCQSALPRLNHRLFGFLNLAKPLIFRKISIFLTFIFSPDPSVAAPCPQSIRLSTRVGFPQEGAL
jgi:hypothetical protein